jgi:hypothetical protein
VVRVCHGPNPRADVLGFGGFGDDTTRHPAAFPEVELSSPVQAAALLSVGLLYQGTAQRLMAEILLGRAVHVKYSVPGA